MGPKRDATVVVAIRPVLLVVVEYIDDGVLLLITTLFSTFHVLPTSKNTFVGVPG